MKIVLDTNVFVSGIFWGGSPSKILKAWHHSKIKLTISEEIFEEYTRVAQFLNKKYPSVDPSDDKFIACALTTGAKFIVSGDRDLLDIKNYLGIEMISPTNFVKIL